MDDGSSFDDVILQVFEEHVDKFTFPLATHKEARDFVRLLNRKGVTYEMVAEEVGEKLNYFENWRLISGEDNAIGNKVLKRLNEPLQDTMGEDDEDNDAEMDKVKQLLFNGRSVDLDDDAAEATLKALDEKRHSKALEAIREAEKQKASEAKESQAKKAAEAKEIEAKAAEAKKAEAKKTEAKKESTESDKVDGKPKESQDSNKVTKKTEEKAKPDAKVSATETDNKEKANNTSAKQPNKQESEKVAEAKNSTVAKEPSTQAKENKSNSNKPTEKPTTTTSLTEEKVTAKVEDKSKTSTTSVPDKSVSKKMEDSKATTSPTETSSPSKSDKEPPTSSVTVLKSVGSPASTASSSKPDNTKQPTSPSTTPSTKTTESKDSSKSSETPPTTKSVNGVTGTADAKPSTISLKVPSEPAKSEVSSPTSPSTPASKSTSTPTTPSTAPSDTNLNLIPPGEINENYDSDLDGEEAGYKSDQAKLIDAVIKFKGAVKDGPGYVYILSDTTGSKPVADLTGIHRVRIGASRFPQKRAKQASTFNPDLKLVTSKHVTHRRASLSKIQEELSSMLYRGTPFWYRGAIDKILEALEALI